MQVEPQDELLTPAAVAALLYVDPKTVTRWAAAGKLAAIRTPGGHRRYLRSEVLAIVAGLHPDHLDHDRGTDPDVHLDLEVGTDRRVAAAAVVAEAVALAAEAAAAEAAEAVLATAVAVTQAAGRAADAAANAHDARALAAETAAQCVALEAERTAARVRLSADLAAARVHHAASLAAEELALLIETGATLDSGRMAEVLAATVVAAAEVQDEDTIRAADAVTIAASAAAEHLAHTLAVAEEFVQGEVAATATAQRELATAAAAAAAVETDARAAAVAHAAAEAAAALLDSDWSARIVDATTESTTFASDRARLSHDLRVPLSSIIASMELLEDELRGHSEGSVVALLARATRAGARMVRMLEENMTPRAQMDPRALPEVDLAEVVRQLTTDSADVLQPAGALVETGMLPVVHADPDGMYSVLQNLLTNSIKFARPGVPLTVQISARRSDDCWRISVCDNGVGLPQAGGLDVFSLFSRGTEAVEGHGIGLATVTRIVANHGGRVGHTARKTGAEIWFEIPADDALG